MPIEEFDDPRGFKFRRLHEGNYEDFEWEFPFLFVGGPAHNRLVLVSNPDSNKITWRYDAKDGKQVTYELGMVLLPHYSKWIPAFISDDRLNQVPDGIISA